ncbi:MAG: phosphoribosylanthranilate isomerase, partial [Chitinophagaceae bacterium]
MTQPQQVAQLASMGVTYAGFIFYPGSQRYVLRHMNHDAIRTEQSIQKVGVFVNADPREVLDLAQKCALNKVQLHGDESPEVCAQINKYVPVVK